MKIHGQRLNPAKTYGRLQEDFLCCTLSVPADALQLSAALVWAGKRPKGHYFVCLDSKLRDAARKEGFTLLPTQI